MAGAPAAPAINGSLRESQRARILAAYAQTGGNVIAVSDVNVAGGAGTLSVVAVNEIFDPGGNAMITHLNRRSLLVGASALGSTIIVRPTLAADYKLTPNELALVLGTAIQYDVAEVRFAKSMS